MMFARTLSVLAVFAATHVPANTDAVRQMPLTGRPLRGSSMWCTVRPPRCHRRWVVVEVCPKRTWVDRTSIEETSCTNDVRGRAGDHTESTLARTAVPPWTATVSTSMLTPCGGSRSAPGWT